VSDGITDADLDALRVELDVRRDLILAHALVHYIHRGHPLALRTLNHNGLRWLEPGQFVLAARIDAGDEFWRIRDKLQGRFEGDAGRRAASDIVARREAPGRSEG